MSTLADKYGCRNHGCVFGRVSGMATNGLCQCCENREDRALARRNRQGVMALTAEAAVLRGLLKEALPFLDYEQFELGLVYNSCRAEGRGETPLAQRALRERDECRDLISRIDKALQPNAEKEATDA